MTNNSKAVVIAGSNVSFGDGITDIVHLGKGHNRVSYESNQVTAGGSFAVRGTDDDGSSQYINSDWFTKQSKLRTSNALISNLATISWFDPTYGGDVIQVKAHVVASDIGDASLVYSAEISGVYSIDAFLTLHEIGTPIVLEWNSFTGAIPTVEIGSTSTGLDIKCQGTGTNTIQWLCTYSYHRLVNVL
jgi:hypothetical protein